MLYCVVLHCIVSETKTILMLYLFNQMILPFCFSSTMFVQKSFKFSVTATSLSDDVCSAMHLPIVGNFLLAKIKSNK